MIKLSKLGVDPNEFKMGESKVDVRSFRRIQLIGSTDEISVMIDGMLKTDTIPAAVLVESIIDTEKKEDELFFG